MGIASINPATGQVVEHFEALSEPAIEAKLALAERAFREYRGTSLAERAAKLQAAAVLLDRDREALARLAVLEMGKTLKSAIAEVEKCASVCRFYAEQGAAFLADEPIRTDAQQSFIRYEPLGLVLAVMPWNFPFWQVFRFAAPALMAGNVGLLKHASNVPQVAGAIEAIFLAAGFPEGVFQSLRIPGDRVAALVADRRIKAATLTGSEPAGASLAAACGRAIKPTVLELGGSDPLIICPSADLGAAVQTAATARLLNNGQSCIAAKRLITIGDIGADFQAQLVATFQAIKVGDPLDPEVDVGPLATAAIADELADQVDRAIAAGAKVLVGGDRSALQASLPEALRGGYFYPPTILAGLSPSAPIAQEEFFGPVALLFHVKSLDEAIALANDTPFGLGASAWTQDASEAHRCINELEAGAVFINGLVKSDPRLPFGGTKRSGYGRELAAVGMREFVNLKTVWMQGL